MLFELLVALVVSKPPIVRLANQQEVETVVNRLYHACGVPCIDGAYWRLFVDAVQKMEGEIVDMMPQPGGAKTLRMSRLSAHEFVQNFVGVSVAKHGINLIILGNHLCCGAYQRFGLNLPDEEALQRKHIARAIRFLNDQVSLTIAHYLMDEDLSPQERENLSRVSNSGLVIKSLLIKPHDMFRPISNPDTECYVERVF